VPVSNPWPQGMSWMLYHCATRLQSWQGIQFFVIISLSASVEPLTLRLWIDCSTTVPPGFNPGREFEFLLISLSQCQWALDLKAMSWLFYLCATLLKGSHFFIAVSLPVPVLNPWPEGMSWLFYHCATRTNVCYSLSVPILNPWPSGL